MDSEGGGTLNSFLQSICRVFAESTRFMVSNIADFVSCSLHNIQICLRNEILRIFGDSGTITNECGQHLAFKNNVIQLLYCIANIHEYVDWYLLEAMWNTFCNEFDMNKKFSKMKKPCLTRWWMVGASVVNLTESWELW